MTQELVSIITPNFNNQNTIGLTIQSVVDQSYSNWEMLIVDDCSSDKSIEEINTWCQKDSRIKLIKRGWNAGPAVTRNRGISEAKGRYIAFLDADDTWYPHKLETQIKFMQELNAPFSYASYRRVDESGKQIGMVKVPKTITYDELLDTCKIGCLTACYDRQVLGTVYMPNIAKRQDFGLWLRLLGKTPKAFGIEECLGDYRVARNSVSSNKIVAAKYQWRVYREVEKLGLIKSLRHFFYYAFAAVLRRL